MHFLAQLIYRVKMKCTAYQTDGESTIQAIERVSVCVCVNGKQCAIRFNWLYKCLIISSCGTTNIVMYIINVIYVNEYIKSKFMRLLRTQCRLLWHQLIREWKKKKGQFQFTTIFLYVTFFPLRSVLLQLANCCLSLANKNKNWMWRQTTSQ